MITKPRLELLKYLSRRPAFVADYPPLVWALDEGYVEECEMSERAQYRLTDKGLKLLEEAK